MSRYDYIYPFTVANSVVSLFNCTYDENFKISAVTAKSFIDSKDNSDKLLLTVYLSDDTIDDMGFTLLFIYKDESWESLSNKDNLISVMYGHIY